MRFLNNPETPLPSTVGFESLRNVESQIELIINTTYIWRKRVGVEPTIRSAKDRIDGFEGREDHRTLFASSAILV